MKTCQHEWTHCAGLGILLCVRCVEEKPCPGCDECAYLRDDHIEPELLEIWRHLRPDKARSIDERRAKIREASSVIIAIEKKALEAWNKTNLQ